MGNRGLDAVRQAVDARLDGLFRSGWVPPTGPGSHGVVPDLLTNPPLPELTEPDERRRSRWRIDPGRRAAAAMIAVVAITALVVGWRVIVGQPRAQALGDGAAVRVSAPSKSLGLSVPMTTAMASGSSGAQGSAAPAPTGVIVVDVVGRVHHPGVVRLPAGSRVVDAVRGAGGALAHTNLAGVNLARVCVDGEQIVVGTAPGASTVAPPAASTAGPAPTPSTGTLVDLNTATAEQLDALPGVGPVMAQRILDWRTTHGAFQSVDQLKQVSGIGDAKFADLSPLVTV